MQFNLRPFLITIIFSFSCFAHLAGEPAVCLTMIVKNEGKIIERCLNSVKDIVDCISICDTGSTDNTVEAIEQFLKETGIPGKVHQHEWVNFGHNRTLSVLAAQKVLPEMGFPLKDTFLLLLDADMMLEISPAFRKDTLKDDSYSVIQKSTSQAYGNTRLIRASLPWKCVGVTHEYWACKGPSKEGKLKTLSIDDRNDGGCKADKFERDIRLLTKGLEDEPGNERYMFYLAQSYKCLDKFEDAIKWYQARIKKGGWYEEVWFSKWMIAQCYEELGQWDKALQANLEAYQFNKDRAEPLEQISAHYLKKGENELAYLFAKQGLSIPYPEHSTLFISYPVYDYLFDWNISIAAYYTSHKEEGAQASNRLMLKRDIPGHIKDQAYKNFTFYVEKLKGARYQPIKIDLPLIREGFSVRYNPMNPSIRKTNEGYELNCRAVNYITIGARFFKTLDLTDTKNTIRTKNFLIKYDKDFNLLSQAEIIEDLPRKKTHIHNIEGLEDCRIFEWNNATWFTCTTLDTNPHGRPQVCLGKLSDERKGSQVFVEKLIPLIGPDLRKCEKNWLPFVKDDELHIIYSHDPFIIYKTDIASDPCPMSLMVKHAIPKHDFSRFSGSTPPIPYNNGYLVLVHEVTHDDDFNRIYYHRFVYLDNDLNITKMTKPFIFLHKGIEYCCGMTVDHSASNLVLSIGIEDREAFLCTVDIDTVNSLLEILL